MSEHIFKLPDLGEGTVESEIGEWFIAEGDFVSEEDLVGTMLTDKAAVELASPVSGTVTRLAGEPGDMVAVGAALVVFETDGSAVTPAPTKDKNDPEKTQPDVAPTTTERRNEDSPPEEPARVMTSPAVRRRAKEAAVDLALVHGSGAGGRISRKDLDHYLKAQATGVPVTVIKAPATGI